MEKPYSYKPAPFFFTAILITWAAWLGAAYFSYQQSRGAKEWLSVLELAGLFGPSCAALCLIFASKDAGLRRDLYVRLFDLRSIKLSTLPAVFLIMPAVVVLSVFLSHLFFGQSLSQLRIAGTVHAASGFIPLPVMFFGAALLEELGWKGYGMDSLRGERTFFTATWIFAALWAFWHIPLFFIDHYYHNTLLRTHPLFALNFFVSILPAAFIINWLWYRNGRNILTAVIFHAVVNCQGLLEMGQIAKCIETGVLIIIAAVIVGSNKKMFFEKFQASPCAMEKIHLKIKDGTGFIAQGYILDISQGGAGIGCDKEIRQGTVVEVVTEKGILPPIKAKVVAAIGVKQRSYAFKLGLEFISPDRRTQKCLEAFIESKEKRGAERIGLL
jgi:membrane protease YdiL (CAAX protease family)